MNNTKEYLATSTTTCVSNNYDSGMSIKNDSSKCKCISQFNIVDNGTTYTVTHNGTTYEKDNKDDLAVNVCQSLSSTSSGTVLKNTIICEDIFPKIGNNC